MTSVGIEAIFTPGGKSTRTGRSGEFTRSPSPSSPSPPRPQAYRRPLVSRAYSVEFELPTSATVPGSVTGTGDIAVSVLGDPSAKNDPQRSTCGASARSTAAGACAAVMLGDTAPEAGV